MSKVVPSEGTLLANKEVLEVEDNCHLPSGNTSGSGQSRGPHEHFITDEKAGKKAAEIGVAATVKSLSQSFQGCALKENGLRTWIDKYLKELERTMPMNGMK